MTTSGALELINGALENIGGLPFFNRHDASWRENQIKMVCDFVVDWEAYELIPKLKQSKDGLSTLIERIEKDDNYMPWEDEDMYNLHECCKKMLGYIEDAILVVNAKDEKENKDVRDDRQMAGEGHYRPQEAMKSSFRAIIQYHDKDGLIKRLHELIDEETSPAMVGAILLRASVFDGLIKRKPTRQEFDDEFHLFKYKNWQSVHNYMDEGSQKALAKANKIVIFE